MKNKEPDNQFKNALQTIHNNPKNSANNDLYIDEDLEIMNANKPTVKSTLNSTCLNSTYITNPIVGSSFFNRLNSGFNIRQQKTNPKILNNDNINNENCHPNVSNNKTENDKTNLDIQKTTELYRNKKITNDILGEDYTDLEMYLTLINDSKQKLRLETLLTKKNMSIEKLIDAIIDQEQNLLHKTSNGNSAFKICTKKGADIKIASKILNKVDTSNIDNQHSFLKEAISENNEDILHLIIEHYKELTDYKYILYSAIKNARYKILKDQNLKDKLPFEETINLPSKNNSSVSIEHTPITYCLNSIKYTCKKATTSKSSEQTTKYIKDKLSHFNKCLKEIIKESSNEIKIKSSTNIKFTPLIEFIQQIPDLHNVVKSSIDKIKTTDDTTNTSIVTTNTNNTKCSIGSNATFINDDIISLNTLDILETIQTAIIGYSNKGYDSAGEDDGF